MLEELGAVERVPGFAELGITAFTTTRGQGSYALQSEDETAGVVFTRWERLQRALAPQAVRLATAHQVHGDRVLVHTRGWDGWLRASGADGHVSEERGTAMAVTIADCVPVFIAHPRGAVAVVHSGWKGTEAAITVRAIERLRAMGYPPDELVVHCGPSICGRCYEVSPEVYHRLTGEAVPRPTPVDLRALIVRQAVGEGVRHATSSAACTRCDNDTFYSHRCGDAGRQLGVIVLPLH